MKELLEAVIIPILTIIILVILILFLYSYTSKTDKLIDIMSKNCITIKTENQKMVTYCKKLDSDGKVYFEEQKGE